MALKTNVGEVFDKILQTAGGRKQPEEKPFWREDTDEKDDKDDKATAKSYNIDDVDDGSPKSFADKVKQARLDGSLDGRQIQDNDEEEMPVSKKKKKSKRIAEDDTSYEDEVDIRIPKKKSKDETPKEDSEDEKEEPEDKKPDTKEDSKEDEKKAEEIKLDEESQNKLDEASEVDPTKLVNKDGRPIGEHGTKAIKRLKGIVTFFAEKSRKLEKLNGNYDPNLVNDYKLIKEAHEDLKKKFEAKYFEETPEWKQKFEKPLEEASQEAVKWIRSHDHSDDSEELAELDKHRVEMQKALKAKDDVKFYEHADSIAEYLKKGAGSRFQNAVPKLWEAYWSREDAMKDKDTARKSVTEETEGFVTAKIKETGINLDVMVDNFEQTNAKIINVYKTKPGIRDLIDYENVVTNKLSETKKLVDQAIRNRSIPAELQKIIFSGILSGLKDKEMEGLREALRQEKEVVARLEKQVEKKDGSLKKVKPSRSVSSDDDDEDEEEGDKVDSFAGFFKKKMAIH